MAVLVIADHDGSAVRDSTNKTVTAALAQGVVGQAVRFVVHLSVGQPPLAADQRHAVRDGIHGALEQVGDVEPHEVRV